MVTAFRAGKTFAGTLKFAGKAALVALINRRIGAVVRHAGVAVIPHVFQRFQVMLQVRVFAVADETAVAQRWIRCFEIEFFIRIHFLLDVEMEAVGVIALIGDARNQPELGGIQTAEAVAQVFARRAVEAEPVASFLFPLLGGLFEAANDGFGLFTQLAGVEDVSLIAEQRVNGFMYADIAQRNRGTAIFENAGNIVVGFQTHAARAFHIEN